MSSIRIAVFLGMIVALLGAARAAETAACLYQKFPWAVGDHSRRLNA